MAAKPGLSTGHANAPRTDGIRLLYEFIFSWQC